MFAAEQGDPVRKNKIAKKSFPLFDSSIPCNRRFFRQQV
jgi:hypothetical protein